MSKQILNKVALITGSREGIGFQTALQLASRKWTVLMADKQDLQEAKEHIFAKTSNVNIFTYHLDLGCFKSVRKCAYEIKETQERLDVLINNAGIFQANQERTVDELNPVMQINHLGPYLLTTLLTDLLKKSSPSRIIFLSSSGAFLHSLSDHNLPALENKLYFPNILEQTMLYYNSKLCNMLISKEFAQRLKESNVTCNCLHPGMTNSNFLLKDSSITLVQYFSPMAYALLELITQSAKESGEMVTFLATSKTLSNTTGEYFVNYQVHRMPKIVYNPDYRKKVWLQAQDLINMRKEETLLLN